MPETRNQCADCGFLNDAQSQYCGHCGINLHERCPGCGAGFRAKQNFCSTCGEPLEPVRTSSAKPQPPDHLAQRILPAEGERKLATVLFADIANSTEIIRDLDAEEAERILAPAVRVMAEIVHRYEGIIVRERGDGIMASFGAPVALEDHAVRACYAALDMHEAVRVHLREAALELGRELQIRIGINSGPVVVTVRYEDDKVRDIRVDGVTTHIAARLEPLARPGTTVLGRDTLSLAEGFVRVHTLPPRLVKGIEQPVQTYRLDGVNTRKRINALASRGRSKFIGREHELETLRRHARQALEGHGQVIAFVGEAGVGKSRMYVEFLQLPELSEWLVLEAGSVSYGKATSYLPLVELLTRYFDIHTTDDEQRVREKVEKKLRAFQDEKLLSQAPYLLGLLRTGLTSEAWTSLTPAERQGTMFNALKWLLIRESQIQPLCLVFEDLHWIDAETQAFLDLLLDTVSSARLLLMVNYRPQYQARWANKSCFSQVRLERLPQTGVDEMLHALLGSAPGLEPIKTALVNVTEGNPLFLEESVRSLLEAGILAGEIGSCRPVSTLPSGFVPPTIEGLVAERIDRLQPYLKEILQCAAVIGSDIPHSLLQGVTEIPHGELERAVRELQAADFIYEKTLFPETVYTIKHAMTREVAHASMLRGRRQMLHARAARVIIGLPGIRLEEYVERVAQHAELGGLWSTAVEYLERAGAKAYALYANKEAADFFERAIKALQHLPQTPATLQQAVDLRFELRNALIALSELDRIRECLEQTEPLLAALGDHVRSARHAAFKCNHHFLAGEQRRAIQSGEAGLGLARECGERAIQGELMYRLGQSFYALGETRSAIALLTQSLEFTPERYERNRFDLSVIPAVVARTWLVAALAEYGDFKAGMNHAKRALQIAEHAEHALSQVLGWLSMGRVLRHKGELAGAIGALERGCALCDRYSLPIWKMRLLTSLGLAYAYSGRFDEGFGLANQALFSADRAHIAVDKPRLLVNLGQISLLAGKIEDALEYGRRALGLALAQEARNDEAWARFVTARAKIASDCVEDDVVADLEKALALSAACEARPLHALCQTALASIYTARGEMVAAAKLTAAGDTAYAELQMRPLPLQPLH